MKKPNLLDPAWKLFQKEKYKKAIEEAENLVDSENVEDSLEARRVIGLSHFRQENYLDAQNIFQQITEHSNLPDDWFNLTTAATLNRNVELSELAFYKALASYKENGTQQNISNPNMHYYYMQALKDIGEFEKAFIQFEKMTELYGSLYVIDSHFLHMRGIPFFEHFLEASKTILEICDSGKVKKRLAELKSEIDDDGKHLVVQLESELNHKK